VVRGYTTLGAVEPQERGHATVLVVCTGNICRSPAVERLLAHALGPAAGVAVGSAGVRAVVGAPMSAPMVELVEAAGASAAGFTARQVTAPLVEGADLVLAMTRAHRAAVVEIVPAAVRRTFTVRELARLLADVDPGALPSGPVPERLGALLPLAAAQRGRRTSDPREDDVVDPYGGGSRLYALAFGQLEPAVRTISEHLLGEPAR
jgi:protein-tyrosine phosphatase